MNETDNKIAQSRMEESQKMFLDPRAKCTISAWAAIEGYVLIALILTVGGCFYAISTRKDDIANQIDVRLVIVLILGVWYNLKLIRTKIPFFVYTDAETRIKEYLQKHDRTETNILREAATEDYATIRPITWFPMYILLFFIGILSIIFVSQRLFDDTAVIFGKAPPDPQLPMWSYYFRGVMGSFGSLLLTYFLGSGIHHVYRWWRVFWRVTHAISVPKWEN